MVKIRKTTPKGIRAAERFVRWRPVIRPGATATMARSQRFFVLEELAALRTAIRIWGECCQTFGAKRDHSAGQGYRAGAVLQQRGKHRFQLFAVPSAQAPVELLAALAILQLEPR